MEIKCQLDATQVFIADLIACSTCFGHHYAHRQELKSIIQWLLPVVFRAVKNVKNNFVFVEFVFSVLSVLCYLGLLLGVSNVVGAVCGCSW